MPSPVATNVSADLAESVRFAAALKACAGDLDAIEDPAMRRSVLDAVEALRSGTHYDETRRFLVSLGQPLFEADPANPDGIIRVDPDGTRTRGTVKGRTFVPAAS